MITGINESKILTKHVSCECKYIFDDENSSVKSGITYFISYNYAKIKVDSYD